MNSKEPFLEANTGLPGKSSEMSNTPFSPGISMYLDFSIGGLNTGRVEGMRCQSSHVFLSPKVIE